MLTDECLTSCHMQSFSMFILDNFTMSARFIGMKFAPRILKYKGVDHAEDIQKTPQRLYQPDP